MAKTAYHRITITSGGSALDGIDGDDLLDGDFAFIMSATLGDLQYILDADLAAAEQSPWIILPDANPGTKCWVWIGGWPLLASDPDTATWGASQEGRRWYNTADHKFKGWNGTDIILIG